MDQEKSRPLRGRRPENGLRISKRLGHRLEEADYDGLREGRGAEAGD